MEWQGLKPFVVVFLFLLFSGFGSFLILPLVAIAAFLGIPYLVFKKTKFGRSFAKDEQRGVFLIIFLAFLIFALSSALLSGIFSMQGRQHVDPYALGISIGGGMSVRESLSYHMEGHEGASELYRSYDMYGAMADMAGISADCSGLQGSSPRLYDKPGTKEIACRMDAGRVPAGEHTVAFMYSVPKPYVCYDDVCIIQWKVMDDFDLEVRNIRVDITGGYSDFYSYPMAEGNAIPALGMGETLEINIIVPRQDVGENEVFSYRGGNFDYGNKNTYALMALIRDNPKTISFMAVFLASAAILLVFFRYGREKQYPDIPEILHFVPTERKPYLVNHMFAGKPGKIDDNGVLSVLMDLARRGYIRIEDRKIIFTRGPEGLDDYEAGVYALYKEMAGKAGTNVYDADELKKRIGSMGVGELGDIVKRGKGIYSLAHAGEFFDRKGRHISFAVYGLLALAGVMLMSMTPLAAAGSSSPLIMGIPVVLAGLVGIAAIFLFDTYALGRYTDEHARERKQWDSFHNLLSDYSLIKKYHPEDINMWGEWLVYATALGAAENVLKAMKEFKVAMPNVAADSFNYFMPVFFIRPSSARIAAANSRAGGGFSGGGGFGGGFGGGGGGFR